MIDWRPYFSFTLVHQDAHCAARAGIIHTPHGDIPTPIFMPVGTHGALKALPPHMAFDEEVKIILCNTYHLSISPGADLVAKAGGLHKFIAWPRPILTDSGGFQVFSLQKKAITEEGATFTAPGGQNITLTPETSLQIQQKLGSDIMMAFDECIPYPADKKYVVNSIARTKRWLERCIMAWQNPAQALFGIVQGGTYHDLRRQAAHDITSFDLPGFAIGGVSVGEGKEWMEDIIKMAAPLLPADKPRYAMGIGDPEDLFMLWENGVDMSDCIIPTKFARGGTLFTKRGKIRIRHHNYRRDFYPIDPSCSCQTCQNFSRAYLKHLFDANEILGQILATNHNIKFYYQLSQDARQAILEDRFLAFKNEFLNNYFKHKNADK